MEDYRIVDMYWERNEHAITQSELKYGKYCTSIAYNVLKSVEDSEECVNDTWNKAWNQMPDARPTLLGAFLGKICRNLAIDRYRKLHSAKRGNGEADIIYDELEECIGRNHLEEVVDQKELERVIASFVAELKKSDRIIFVKRYWYMEPVKNIAKSLYVSESKVKTSLFRSRVHLETILRKEGFELW